MTDPMVERFESWAQNVGCVRVLRGGGRADAAAQAEAGSLRRGGLAANVLETPLSISRNLRLGGMPIAISLRPEPESQFGAQVRLIAMGDLPGPVGSLVL